jgi:Fe2+ transport system protein B
MQPFFFYKYHIFRDSISEIARLIPLSFLKSAIITNIWSQLGKGIIAAAGAALVCVPDIGTFYYRITHLQGNHTKEIVDLQLV